MRLEGGEKADRPNEKCPEGEIRVIERFMAILIDKGRSYADKTEYFDPGEKPGKEGAKLPA